VKRQLIRSRPGTDQPYRIGLCRLVPLTVSDPVEEILTCGRFGFESLNFPVRTTLEYDEIHAAVECPSI
jgi:hypothetical protein